MLCLSWRGNVTQMSHVPNSRWIHQRWRYDRKWHSQRMKQVAHPAGGTDKHNAARRIRHEQGYDDVPLELQRHWDTSGLGFNGDCL